MRMTLQEVALAAGASVTGLNAQRALFHPGGAAIDSRAVRSGDLFFCLPGERADGHDFAAAAAQKGASAIIAARNPFGTTPAPVPLFLVADPVVALGRIAAAHRDMAPATVVGVTGTSGKTSVKEVLAAVLGQQGPTAKNHVNLNNQIGLPLSMLNATDDAVFWVMEAGISKPGDMDELGAILRPDIALVLNAGSGHTQGLGDRGVAHYKARLLDYLTPGGQGVVSADYPDLVRESCFLEDAIVWFSAQGAAEAAYSAVYLGSAGVAAGQFRLTLAGETVQVTAPFAGTYGAENVAAVGAVAHLLGLSAPAIAAGFAEARLPEHRFAVTECGRFRLIDDSYNANPLSMFRMLEAAQDMARADGRPLVLVLGEMGELGPESPGHHEALGQRIAAAAPLALFWKGGEEESLQRGLVAGGYTGHCTGITDAEGFMTAFGLCGIDTAVVLFKGSRANRLEELAAAFAVRVSSPEKGSADAV